MHICEGLREKSCGGGGAERRPQEWLDECFIFPPEVGERLDHDEGIEGWVTQAEMDPADLCRGCPH